MIHPLGHWTLRHIAWLPLALYAAMLVRRNYAARMRGEMPDEWHWADKWLCDHGFYVDAH
jgi:hypothetical protein